MNEGDARLQFRPFRNKDQRGVRELIIEGLGDHFGVLDEKFNYDLKDINANYTAKGHTFIVAEIGSQLVGAGALMIIDDRTARMVRVSVARSRRRQGIGTAIVSQLVSIARENDIERVLVETNHDWLDAIALYERCGFVTTYRDDISTHMQFDLSGD